VIALTQNTNSAPFDSQNSDNRQFLHNNPTLVPHPNGVVAEVGVIGV
jgi:hypothetical protein